MHRKGGWEYNDPYRLDLVPPTRYSLKVLRTRIPLMPVDELRKSDDTYSNPALREASQLRELGSPQPG